MAAVKTVVANVPSFEDAAANLADRLLIRKAYEETLEVSCASALGNMSLQQLDCCLRVHARLNRRRADPCAHLGYYS